MALIKEVLPPRLVPSQHELERLTQNRRERELVKRAILIVSLCAVGSELFRFLLGAFT